MGPSKCEHIKGLITLTSDYIKQISMFYYINFRKANHLRKIRVWSSVKRFPTTSASGLTKTEPSILCHTLKSQDQSDFSEYTKNKIII